MINILALLPLLDKFEDENGTITTVLLFFGRKISPYRGVTRLNQADIIQSLLNVSWPNVYNNMLTPRFEITS